ncbi:MAG TPA: hypothetical protein VMW20_00715, partial [Candidatus Nanoarchaeia archaeon]|nr:hypothetical protein [Candidatus Nanoarchaeia archaeon]
DYVNSGGRVCSPTGVCAVKPMNGKMVPLWQTGMTSAGISMFSRARLAEVMCYSTFPRIAITAIRMVHS